jgi:hypothetical protein
MGGKSLLGYMGDKQGYMGDKQMSFPETVAQSVLMKGFDKPTLRDEANGRS